VTVSFLNHHALLVEGLLEASGPAGGSPTLLVVASGPAGGCRH